MQRLMIIAVASFLLLTLSACGGASARTVTAYCDTVAKHRDRYLAAMDEASSAGGLEGLFAGVGAIGDIKNMWSDLAKVAPDEIQTDTEAVRDAWKATEDAANSGDFFGVFSSAFSNSGPTERVNDYIGENCGAEYAP